MIHKLFWTADEGMKVNMIIAVKWAAYSVEKYYLKNFAPLSQKVRSGISFKPLRATLGHGLRNYWTFEKISAFPVCDICFIEIIHDKLRLTKALGKLKMLNYNTI